LLSESVRGLFNGFVETPPLLDKDNGELGISAMDRQVTLTVLFAFDWEGEVSLAWGDEFCGQT
jgi:hypothetical protein